MVRQRTSAGLVLRNAAFTVAVPGAGGVLGPWLVLSAHGGVPERLAWVAAPVIAAGVLLYLSCQWRFATTGRGTPGTWDPPRRLVAVGPYRRVRNPIYVAALLILLGEAGLFRSVDLLVYAGVVAAAVHLLVVCYEEPRLSARFGAEYEEYRRRVGRWLPRPPRPPRPPGP